LELSNQYDCLSEIIMPSRPTGGTSWARFTLYGIGDLKEFSNIFWYSVTSGSFLPTTNYQAICAAFYAMLTTPLIVPVSLTYTYRGVIGEFNDGAGTTGVEYYQNVLGTAVTDPLPEDVAVVVRKKTANTTRDGSGRWYFAGTTSADTIGSYLNSTGISDWQGVAVAAKSVVSAGSIVLSPAHFSPKTGLLYPILETPVVALLGTRRRRRGPF